MSTSHATLGEFTSHFPKQGEEIDIRGRGLLVVELNSMAIPEINYGMSGWHAKEFWNGWAWSPVIQDGVWTAPVHGAVKIRFARYTEETQLRLNLTDETFWYPQPSTCRFETANPPTTAPSWIQRIKDFVYGQ